MMFPFFFNFLVAYNIVCQHANMLKMVNIMPSNVFIEKRLPLIYKVA